MHASVCLSYEMNVEQKDGFDTDQNTVATHLSTHIYKCTNAVIVILTIISKADGRVMLKESRVCG